MAKPRASPPISWLGNTFTPKFNKDASLQNSSLVLFKETLLKEVPDRSFWFHACLAKSGSLIITRASSSETANLPVELTTIISSCRKEDLTATESIANAQRLGIRVVNSAVNSYITVFSVDATFEGKTSQAIIEDVAKSLFSIGNRNCYFRSPVEIRSVQVSAEKGKTYFYLTTTSPIVAARIRAALQNTLKGDEQRLQSLMARSSKNLIRAQCFMKGVSRSTPMVTIHTIVKPYGSIVNGSLKYLADSISCTICVFDNCKPLPSQLERVILRAESNIPMLCKIGNIFLGCAPSPAGAVPAPDAVSAVPALTAVSVPEQILSSSLASLSNNTSLPSDYSDDPDISNVIHLAEVTPARAQPRPRNACCYLSPP